MTNKQQIEQESVSNEFLSGSLNYLDQVQDVKPYKTHRSLKPLIVALLIIAVVCGGVLVVLDTTNHAPEEIATNAPVAEVSDAQVQLAACLRTANLNNVEVGDPEFYPKLIANYKTQIACYDKFDGDNPEIESLREHLNSIEIAARDAGVSQAAIDAEYERRTAQIEEEYRQQMAALDAKAAQQDEETRRKLEQSDAEWAKQKAEQEAQRAQYEAQQRAREEAEAKAAQEKIARCNAYRAQYGTKTPQELAENDPEVRGRYETWQRSVERSKAAGQSDNVAGQSAATERANELKKQVLSDYNAYNAKLQEKINYYAKLSLACN